MMRVIYKDKKIKIFKNFTAKFLWITELFFSSFTQILVQLIIFYSLDFSRQDEPIISKD